jgi:iron complex outermembrane receptor protein
MLTQLLLAATLAAGTDTLVVPMQEVVVTGTRTPESALRLPAGISVVKAGAFTDTRGNSLKDALADVPGVFVQSRAGSQDVRITIRGFGARGNGERSNAGNIRGIRVLTDGVSITEPDGRTSLDLVDIGSADRVEVVRSNASALYGNASGGIVNLRTDLSFDEPYAEYRERAGAYGYHREQAVTGFVTGGMRGVFSLSNSTFEGWRRHSAGSATLASLRMAVPVGAKDRLGVLVDAVSDINRFPGALTRAQSDADPAQASDNYMTRDERRRNRVGRVALTWDQALEPSMDLSLTGFVEPKVLQRSERNRFRDFGRYHVGGSGVFSVRSSLSSGVRSRLSVGVDEAFQDGSIHFYSLTAGGGRGTDLIANKREGANSVGGFVEEELAFATNWSARVAARWDALWYISEDYIDPTIDATKTFRQLTPKGSLSYRLGEHTIYASLGGGVEAPAFNEIDPPPSVPPTSLNPFLEPMRSVTYELGAKGVMSAGGLGRMEYDAALYSIDVRNDIVPYNGGSYFFTAGKSRRRGAELGVAVHPARGISVSGSLNASDNTFVAYSNDLGDYAGHKVPGLPDFTGTARARYESPQGPYAEIGVEHVNAYFADDANQASTRAHTLVNATAGFEVRAAGRIARAFVGVNNLTDQAYDASVFINGLGGQYFEPGLPRNWFGGLTVRGF